MNQIEKLLLGAHFSISGGLHKAFDPADRYGCRAMQIFTQSANTWKTRKITEDEKELFIKRWQSSCVEKAVSHAGYLINLAGSDFEKRKKSFEALKKEIERAEYLGIELVVLHPGSHMKTSVSEGIKRVSDAVNKIFDESCSGRTKILFETMAGQGDCVGSEISHLEDIINGVKRKERIGVCIDTCHVFASGSDISFEKGWSEFLESMISAAGLDKILCFHLNDSKKDCGTKVDRHGHIGEGKIGLKPFELILNDKRFDDIPKIIELQDEENGKDMNAANFSRLASLAGQAS